LYRYTLANKEEVDAYQPGIGKFFGHFSGWSTFGPSGEHVKAANASRYEVGKRPMCNQVATPMVRDVGDYNFGGSCSTIFSAMQFVLYTGIQELYVVGCDVSAGSGGYSASAKKSNVAAGKKPANLGRMLHNWKMARHFLATHYPCVKVTVVRPVGLKQVPFLHTEDNPDFSAAAVAASVPASSPEVNSVKINDDRDEGEGDTKDKKTLTEAEKKVKRAAMSPEEKAAKKAKKGAGKKSGGGGDDAPAEAEAEAEAETDGEDEDAGASVDAGAGADADAEEDGEKAEKEEKEDEKVETGEEVEEAEVALRRIKLIQKMKLHEEVEEAPVEEEVPVVVEEEKGGGDEQAVSAEKEEEEEEAEQQQQQREPEAEAGAEAAGAEAKEPREAVSAESDDAGATNTEDLTALTWQELADRIKSKPDEGEESETRRRLAAGAADAETSIEGGGVRVREIPLETFFE
jgi:hypothetical protein